MGTSLRKENFKIITFDIDNQGINALATYEKVIALGSDKFNVCHITLWNKYDAAVTLNARRASAYITATKDFNKAYAQGVRYELIGVQGYFMTYYVPNYRYSGFSYATDAKLTERSFDTTGRRIEVEKAIIDGSDLKLTFKNPGGTYGRIYVEGRIKAESLIEVT